MAAERQELERQLQAEEKAHQKQVSARIAEEKMQRAEHEAAAPKAFTARTPAASQIPPAATTGTWTAAEFRREQERMAAERQELERQLQAAEEKAQLYDGDRYYGMLSEEERAHGGEEHRKVLESKPAAHGHEEQAAAAQKPKASSRGGFACCIGGKNDEMDLHESEFSKAQQLEGLRVYGVDVDCFNLLPVVSSALQWLTDNQLQSEGLWRTCGSKKELSRLEIIVDESGAFPANEIVKAELMTGLLVRFLKQIPGGLVDATTSEDLAIIFGPEIPAEDLLCFIKGRLSNRKFELFVVFLDHWKHVVSTDENKMDASGVATCVFSVVFSVVDLVLIEVLARMLEAPCLPAQNRMSYSDGRQSAEVEVNSPSV